MASPRRSSHTGSRRGSFIAGFGHAFDGVRWAVKTQRNMRFHLAAGALVIALGLLLRVSRGDMVALLLACTVVIAAEMFNTMAEAVVDLASPDYHHLAKVAKDVAAGAVLVSAIGAAVIGLVVFIPYL